MIGQSDFVFPVFITDKTDFSASILDKIKSRTDDEDSIRSFLSDVDKNWTKITKNLIDAT